MKRVLEIDEEDEHDVKRRKIESDTEFNGFTALVCGDVWHVIRPYLNAMAAVMIFRTCKTIREYWTLPNGRHAAQLQEDRTQFLTIDEFCAKHGPRGGVTHWVCYERWNLLKFVFNNGQINRNIGRLHWETFELLVLLGEGPAVEMWQIKPESATLTTPRSYISAFRSRAYDVDFWDVDFWKASRYPRRVFQRVMELGPSRYMFIDPTCDAAASVRRVIIKAIIKSGVVTKDDDPVWLEMSQICKTDLIDIFVMRYEHFSADYRRNLMLQNPVYQEWRASLGAPSLAPAPVLKE